MTLFVRVLGSHPDVVEDAFAQRGGSCQRRVMELGTPGYLLVMRPQSDDLDRLLLLVDLVYQPVVYVGAP